VTCLVGLIWLAIVSLVALLALMITVPNPVLRASSFLIVTWS
jgi:hypothetical protein